MTIQSAKYLGYDVDIETGEISAPCGCIACDHSVQQGHFACSLPPEDLLEDEQTEDGCWRSYEGNEWRWFAPSYAWR
jgi:hypothetical protein